MTLAKVYLTESQIIMGGGCIFTVSIVSSIIHSFVVKRWYVNAAFYKWTGVFFASLLFEVFPEAIVQDSYHLHAFMSIRSLAVGRVKYI